MRLKTIMRVLSIIIIAFRLGTCQSEIVRFGIQATPSQAYADEHWYPMLQAAVQGLGKTASVQAIMTDVVANQVVANASLDYFYMGASLYDCLQTQFDIAPVVSSIQNVNNTPTQYIGSAIVARQDSNFYTMQDLRGARIALPQLAYLSSCQAQWFELLVQLPGTVV